MELRGKEIFLQRKLNLLDKLVLDFVQILEKHARYVIISGYISILLGRARATEDVDLFIEKIDVTRFIKLYEDLNAGGFWCLNAESSEEVYSYLREGLAIRFARKNTSIPNFEMKFPKRKVDEETFEDTLTAVLPDGCIIISSLERQIAFKRYFLKAEKDVEDALHIEEIFRDQLDYDKINKLKKIIEENERREGNQFEGE